MRRSNLIALDTASDLLLSSLSRLSWRTFAFMWTGGNWFKCCRFLFSISSRNWLPTIGGFSLFSQSTVYHNWTTDGLNRRSEIRRLSVVLCNFFDGVYVRKFYVTPAALTGRKLKLNYRACTFPIGLFNIPTMSLTALIKTFLLPISPTTKQPY